MGRARTRGVEHALVGPLARPAPPPDCDVIAAAVRAAQDSDVAIVVVGLTRLPG
jgi:hypothetical protein